MIRSPGKGSFILSWPIKFANMGYYRSHKSVLLLMFTWTAPEKLHTLIKYHNSRSQMTYYGVRTDWYFKKIILKGKYIRIQILKWYTQKKENSSSFLKIGT